MAKKSKPIEIDIFDMEMSKGLPHWLDPIESLKGTHDDERKKNQIKHANEIQAKAKKKSARR
jgi:hypothetical protein